VLLRFEIGQVTVRLHAWPLSGWVTLGAPSLKWLRTRVWLAVLMGPATNGALLLLTVRFWSTLEAVVGDALVSTWFFVNLLMMCGNLLPFRTSDAGRVIQSDGLTLLTLPLFKDLTPFLLSAPVMRAMGRFEREDFPAARPHLEQALERVPGHVGLIVSLAACHSSAGEHARCIALLTPLLTTATDEAPRICAAMHNNLAFSHLMIHAKSHSKEGDLAEAERFSNLSFSEFPCIVELRSTRAFVLAATGRAADALALLQYVHYQWASARQRAAQEAARAYALTVLNRPPEAREAAERATQLHPESREWLTCLGVPFATTPAAVPLEPAPANAEGTGAEAQDTPGR
jgi:hypothetical protein